MARDGVLDRLSEAKKQGKVRFVGFTGTQDSASSSRHALPRSARSTLRRCRSTVLDATFRSFEKQVLPEGGRGCGMAVLGDEEYGWRRRAPAPGSGPAGGTPCANAMSLPVTVTISGIDALTVPPQNLAVMLRGLTPMSETQMQTLRDRCSAVAGDGHLELYKSTMKYDGDVGREQHGYQLPKELPL